MGQTERTCLHCGKRWSVALAYLRARQKHGGDNACSYCSLSCSIAAQRERRSEYYERRICEHCKNSFEYLKSRNPNRQFCSQPCKIAAGRAEFQCAGCDKTFTAMRCIARKYCSQRCAGVSRNRVALSCEICGDNYDRVPSQAPVSKTCSRKCLAVLNGLRRTKHAIDNRTRVGRKSWRILRNQIIERDGGKCTQCGASHVLVVHHIVEWRKTQDDSPENLTTLCRTCHADLHGYAVLGGAKSHR